MKNDLIDRQAAIDALGEEPMVWTDDNDYAIGERNQWQIDKLAIETVPSAQPEIIRCKDCIYYDPPHVEDAGIRYEYKDMPKDAFDKLGTGLVHSGYGINVGGRCTRDYNKGYSEDKRVFISETNYCGRAERREDG